MTDTRESLEALWQKLWAEGQEIDERQKRLLSSTDMEPALFDRAMAQLESDREEHQERLLDLRRRMKEHGGFE